jgi:hypothetical protein
VSPFGFVFTLELEDGTPAEPARFETAVRNWNPGDVIPRAREGSLRVIATRLDESSDGGDPVPVLVVERA